ncbi:hypothetical protein SDC9_80024 [bioreactor metagenome]|uniref:Uncharacterized protein n=1 Tax=bioreactor metagenome TaxID=1076179 RepID=A0A644YYS2_9ZZZZ
MGHLGGASVAGCASLPVGGGIRGVVCLVGVGGLTAGILLSAHRAGVPVLRIVGLPLAGQRVGQRGNNLLPLISAAVHTGVIIFSCLSAGGRDGGGHRQRRMVYAALHLIAADSANLVMGPIPRILPCAFLMGAHSGFFGTVGVRTVVPVLRLIFRPKAAEIMPRWRIVCRSGNRRSRQHQGRQQKRGQLLLPKRFHLFPPSHALILFPYLPFKITENVNSFMNKL